MNGTAKDAKNAKRTKGDIDEKLIKEIVDSAYTVHKILGCGFLEKVYENALIHELETRDLKVEGQVPITIYYKDIEAGNYFVDVLVNEMVILELKTCERLTDVHLAQILNYLKATRKRVGLLINFANQKIEIRRVINSKIF